MRNQEPARGRGMRCERHSERQRTLSEEVEHTYHRIQAVHSYVYTREKKAYVLMKTCTQTFRAALSVPAPNWKRPECPSTSEQAKTVVQPCDAIPPHTNTEGTTDSCYNSDTCQNDSAAWKKQTKQRTHCTIPFAPKSSKCKWTCRWKAD